MKRPAVRDPIENGPGAGCDRVSLSELATPFQLFHFIAGTDDLHFGLYENGEGDTIRTAQRRMRERHIAHVPRAASRILDGGCGLGGTCCELAARGHRVLALDPQGPSLAHARRLARRRGVNDRIEFVQGTFDAVAALPPGSLDGAVFQETFQHAVDPLATLGQVHRALAAGGRCIIGDQILRDADHRGAVRWHPTEDILGAARHAGFEVLAHEDLSSGALPTMEWATAELERRRAEILDAFGTRIEGDLETCIQNGRLELEAWRAGIAGFALFVLERRDVR